MLMNAGRILVNTPTSQGAVGYLYNNLPPSLTLGCGTGGKNITTENITARNLINIQRVCRRKENEYWRDFDKSLYFDEAFDAEAVFVSYSKICLKHAKLAGMGNFSIVNCQPFVKKTFKIAGINSVLNEQVR